MNDEVKMAEMEGQLRALVDSVARIEIAVQTVIGIDRSMAEMKVTQSHTSEALGHIRSRVEQNQTSNNDAHILIHSRIDLLSKEQTKFESRVMGAWYVTCGLATIVVAISTWALSQITESARLNVQQDQRIYALEHQPKGDKNEYRRN